MIEIYRLEHLHTNQGPFGYDYQSDKLYGREFSYLSYQLGSHDEMEPQFWSAYYNEQNRRIKRNNQIVKLSERLNVFTKGIGNGWIHGWNSIKKFNKFCSPELLKKYQSYDFYLKQYGTEEEYIESSDGQILFNNKKAICIGLIINETLIPISKVTDGHK